MRLPTLPYRNPKAQALFLALIGLVLVLIWIPNLRYHLLADPSDYAILSRQLWQHGSYDIFGVPNDVLVPMNSIISYIFIGPLGLNLGMKTASLAYGILFCCTVFLFFRRESPDDDVMPWAVTALVALTPQVTWLLGVGNADTLYGWLFYSALLLTLLAKNRTWLYVPIGILIGVTMLTRYMGVALLPIIGLYVLLERRPHLRSASFWSLFPVSLAILSLWFIRHKLTFGTWFNLFHVEFTLHAHTPIALRVLQNGWFYLNPAHTLFLLFPFFVAGLAWKWREHLLVTIAIPLSLILCYVYPSVTSRYLVATFPLLLFYTVWGVRWAMRAIPRWLVATYLAIALLAQAGMTCMYAEPQCNAFVDRLHIAAIPADLGFSQEGFESREEAMDWMNGHAESGATVIVTTAANEMEILRDAKRMRAGLAVADHPSCTAPSYLIARRHEATEFPDIVYETPNVPHETVRRIDPRDCRLPMPQQLNSQE